MSDVKCRKAKQNIPTYIPKKAHGLPMFFEHKPYQGASGKVYPIPYCDGISDEKTDVEYDVYTLENEYIKTQVLPALGGKILRGFDKVGEYDFIYYNEVVKPALVGLAGPWISGGIEFNFPQHHRPTTFMPLEATEEALPGGGKTVWVGEVEPLGKMKGMVGITVDPDRSYIRAKVRIYNRTALPQVFMWWANLAVPANENYRTVFPPDCEWVNDHDRRAVLEWPVARGVYKTARPYDFGTGTDLSRYDAVKVPSSYLISQGQSEMDFIAGYDTGIGKGIVTVANHHIAPGKKMWHWGTGAFGEMWCSNLTDRNGPYIELMTGVYTDNQPDFTWIAPYETKEFEQYWYPVREIGEIKNATIDAAVNVEKREDGLYIGFNVTGVFPGSTVTVTDGDRTLYRETVDLSPDAAYQKTIRDEISDLHRIRVTLTDREGRELVSYTPVRRGEKQPIRVRPPVRRPEEYATVEELYINGFHLEQYKQHNYRPEDYYTEGLRRDPGDIRCNTSMARLSLKNGRFEDCVRYCDRAIERLCDRNEHPADTEALYLKGIALTYLGERNEAYDVLYRAAWNYPHRSAAMFELACLDSGRGDYSAALEKLAESVGGNRGHTKAQNLRTAILRRIGSPDARRSAMEGIRDDRLDLFALIEASHFTEVGERIAPFASNPENFMDVARDDLRAGLYEDAVYALGFADRTSPLVNYYLAYLTKDTSYLEAAEKAEPDGCFPASLEDISVLKYAIANNGNAANADYYLGCLYYDRFRYAEAAEHFEACVRKNPAHGAAWRNLSLYLFDHAGEPERAIFCMKKAMQYRPGDARLLLEYEQLLKNTGAGIDERLAVYEAHPVLLAERDDCYLDRLTLLSQRGRFEEAIRLAAGRRFHIYEGGEGKLTKLHAWMHVLYGNEMLRQGDLKKAEQLYRAGTVIPKSYGEAKTFFNQEAHLYYFLGRLYKVCGERGQEKAAYEKAAEYKAAVSEISLFRALALRALGKEQEAKDVLEEMLAEARKLIENKDRRPYYGVGSPSPMPFEGDIEKRNLFSGNLLGAFALYGLGRYGEAEQYIRRAEALEPNDFTVSAYRRVTAALES